MQLNKKRIEEFQKEILDWYNKNKRDLPWRRPSLKLRNGKGRDPYAILVSEIMLQQTQVSRVIPKFEAWIKRFPTLKSLAKATTRDVLSLWSGLGYNRRALYLKKLAEEVVKNSNGVFSHEERELLKLPGIGRYTARALLCFAFDKQVAVVDTNVRKVILTRIMNVIPAKAGVQEDGSRVKSGMIKKNEIASRSLAMTNKEIQKIADQLLPKGKAYEWNQALMDYAAAMLKKEKIDIPKQSKFKTSKRFYRGQIIRLLLQKKGTVQSLFEQIKNNGISLREFQTVLLDIEKEGLIKRKKEVYCIE